VLSEARRDALAVLKQDALAWCIASASVEEIDKLNILQATMLAMSRAVAGPVTPGRVLIDGNRVPKQISLPPKPSSRAMPRCRPFRQPPFWPRQRVMPNWLRWMHLHPQYGFARHKGYHGRTSGRAGAVRGAGRAPQVLWPGQGLAGTPARPAVLSRRHA
jgi:ribonuclease HII